MPVRNCYPSLALLLVKPSVSLLDLLAIVRSVIFYIQSAFVLTQRNIPNVSLYAQFWDSALHFTVKRLIAERRSAYASV